MSIAFAGRFGGAALLLLAAGATKVADPSRTVGALAEAGWPSSVATVRLGAGVEVLLGAGGLVVGGPALAAVVALSYLAFAWFVAAVLRSGEPFGTCGCFAVADAPPRPSHLVIDLALAGGALAATIEGGTALIDAPAAAWPLAAVVAGLGYILLSRPRRLRLRDLSAEGARDSW